MKTVGDILSTVAMINTEIANLTNPNGMIRRDEVIELLEEYKDMLLTLPIKR